MKNRILAIICLLGFAGAATARGAAPQKQTFTGTVQLLVILDPTPRVRAPLYMVDIKLNQPAEAGYSRICGIPVYDDDERKVGKDKLREGDVISFEGNPQVLFSGKIRLSNLGNVRILRRTNPKCGGPRALPKAPRGQDQRKTPFAAPGGFDTGARPEKKK